MNKDIFVTYFKLGLLSRYDHGHDRQTILTLLQIELQLNVVRAPQRALVNHLVLVVVLSVLLDGPPGVRPHSLLQHHVVRILPPLLNVFGERDSWVKVAVFSKNVFFY